jgi:hypothetical protein
MFGTLDMWVISMDISRSRLALLSLRVGGPHRCCCSLFDQVVVTVG